MIGTFQPRLDILPTAQRSLWPNLHPTQRLGFVLYGDTAIALRLGHRESVDFDFFTDRPLDQSVLWESLPFLHRSTVLQNARDSLTVLVPDAHTANVTVKFSFFGGVTMGRVGTPALAMGTCIC